MHAIVDPIPILKDNYVWAVIKQNDVIVVDPGEALPVIRYLQQHQLTLKGIFITHHHWDHTGGLMDLISQYPVPVFGSAYSQVAELTHFVHEHDQVILDAFPHYQVMDIPGHTIDHIAYYSSGVLFCGDTLFAGGCGRLFEGSVEQLYASLQKIAALPAHTKIYCAHEYTLNNLRFAQMVEPGNQKIGQRLQQVSGYRIKNRPSLPSLLREEKETNPFLRCHSPELIQCVEQHIGYSLSHPVDVFRELRQWKDQF